MGHGRRTGWVPDHDDDDGDGGDGGGEGGGRYILFLGVWAFAVNVCIEFIHLCKFSVCVLQRRLVGGFRIPIVSQIDSLR